jgi:8-oxo-dGTP pyrophosphatase MutT (NUDIX family)
MEIAEPEAAVAIVRAILPKESVLLIRRSERPDDSWSGHWSFPGGRRDPGDSDLLHTALRELEEECGVSLGREQCEAELPPVLARRRAKPFVLVAPFVFGIDGELPTVVDHREAVEALWMPLSTWRDPASHTLRAVPGLPEDWLFPAIDLNGLPLWGFTYRLAADWLGLTCGTGPMEQPGFALACRVLDFLRSVGLKLTHGWEDCIVPTEPEVIKVARVEGAIPVAEVASRFTASKTHFPSVNLMEIQPDKIRLVGLAFEEYLISSTG